MNDDGDKSRQLTHNTTWDIGPVWSPDADNPKIAFYGAQFKEPYGEQDVTTLPQIFVIPADSTDGKAQALTPEITIEQFLAGYCTDQVNKDVPCGATFPSWSPTGDKIAFQEARGGDLFVIDADGNNLRKLPARGGRVDWNSNGSQIVYQSGQGTGAEIYVTNADGTGTPIKLTNNAFSDGAPNLSPDDSKLVFQSDRDHLGKTIRAGSESEPLMEIYVMDLILDDKGNITGASPNNPTRLTTCNESSDPATGAITGCTNQPTDSPTTASPRNLDPDWAPDGEQIAFHRPITYDNPSISSTDAVQEIFVIDAKDADGDGQGDNLKQLTQLPSENAHAGWGPS